MNTLSGPPTPSCTPGGWTPGPAQPRLETGLLDVWRADLTAVGDELSQTLSSDERERAERMLSEHNRSLWMRSRGVLRALLGRYLDEDPGTLRFSTGAHGKPALLEGTPAGSMPGSGRKPRPTVPLQFNLSHSGDLAVYAFAAGPAVGIDVELERRTVDEVAIAARTFGAAEASRLRDLDADTRKREFMRAWTRHEAQLKCLGVGIGGEGAVGNASRPWIADLGVGPRAAAAVAVEVAPRELRCWDWVA